MSSSSTSSLLPKTHSTAPPQKDYAASLAQLQGAYGFGGMPTPFDRPSSHSKTLPKTSEVSSLPLPPPPYSAKDYPAALAGLHSTIEFGSGGLSAPLLPFPSPKSSSSSSTKSRRRVFSKPSSARFTSPSPEYSASIPPEKDFSSGLQSSQSFRGFTAAPILPSDSSLSPSTLGAQGVSRSRRLRNLFSSSSTSSSSNRSNSSHMQSGIPTTVLGRI